MQWIKAIYDEAVERSRDGFRMAFADGLAEIEIRFE